MAPTFSIMCRRLNSAGGATLIILVPVKNTKVTNLDKKLAMNFKVDHTRSSGYIFYHTVRL